MRLPSVRWFVPIALLFASPLGRQAAVAEPALTATAASNPQRERGSSPRSVDPISELGELTVLGDRAHIVLVTGTRRRVRMEVSAPSAEAFHLIVGDPDRQTPSTVGPRALTSTRLPLRMTEMPEGVALTAISAPLANAAGHGAAHLKFTRRPFALALVDTQGRTRFALSAPDTVGLPGLWLRRGEPAGDGLSIAFRIDPGAHWFGLAPDGGRAERSGTRIAVNQPTLLAATSGFGLAWLTGQPASFSIGTRAEAPEALVIDVVSERASLLLLAPVPTATTGIGSPRLKDVLASYAALIARPDPPPKWAHGVVFGRDQYTARAEVETVVNTLRANRFPFDAVAMSRRWPGTETPGDKEAQVRWRDAGVTMIVGPPPWAGWLEPARPGHAGASFSFAGMRAALRGTLSAGLSGWPLASPVQHGTSSSEANAELFTRHGELLLLAPFACFTGNQPREPWAFGAPAQAILADHARLRYSLLPYLLAAVSEAASTGTPVWRHLALEFPDDPSAPTIDDQFMLGPDLLVAPVVLEGATRRLVYFPRGDWYPLDDSRPRFSGPAFSEVAAPLDELPIFVRAGSVIPRLLGNPQHLKGGPSSPVRLDIYPGTGTAVARYQDEGLVVSARKQATLFDIRVTIAPVPLPIGIRLLHPAAVISARDSRSGRDLLVESGAVTVNARHGTEVRFQIVR